MEDCIEAEVERAKAVLPISAWNTVREFAERAAWKDRMDWFAKISEPIYLNITSFEFRCCFSTSDLYGRETFGATRPDVHIVQQSRRYKDFGHCSS